MLKDLAKATEQSAQDQRVAQIQPLYLKAVTLVERVHRRLLEVIKDEFDRRSRDDINAIQALLLYNIGEQEVTAGELRTRGYYLGSNVSYNLKKLVEFGYLDHPGNVPPRNPLALARLEVGRGFPPSTDWSALTPLGNLETPV